MDNSSVQAQAEAFERIRAEVGRVVVGQEKILDRLLAALVCQGHVLLEGVPGIAKTTLVRTLARAIGLSFGRVSFTPDLLPADVTGTLVYSPFTNLLLADEINRAPAKVQSALLEAMQERQVTIGEATYPLPSPFLVLATQNPIEQEGTYPLPEAQVDRFMFKCVVGLPGRDDERRIMDRFTRRAAPEAQTVAGPEAIAAMREALDGVYCDEKVGDYILDLVFATRDPASRKGLADLAPLIALGASPRATLCLNLAARAHAMLRGRAYATPQDVKEVAPDVLRHRVQLTYEAEAQEMTSDKVVARILDEVPVP